MKKNMLLFSRLKNTYLQITIISLSLFLVPSWLFSSGLLPALWGYNDEIAVPYKEYITLMWDQMLCWEGFIDNSMRYIVFIFPVFPSFVCVGFMDEIESYLITGANRFENRKRATLRSAIQYSILGGLVTTIPIFILTYAVDYLMYPAVDYYSGIALLFPKGYYYDHTMIVLLTMIILLYFPLACAYSMIAVSIALITRKRIEILLIPELIYMGLNFISLFSKNKLPVNVMDILTAYNTDSTPKQLFLKLAFQMILSLSIFLISYFYEIKRKLVTI